MSRIVGNELITVGKNKVPSLAVTKGSSNIFNVNILDCAPGCLLQYIVKRVDNLTVVCKQHIDDSRYVFKIDLQEETQKQQPKIQMTDHPSADIACIYHIRMDSDVLRNVNPGKYWWTIRVEVNGDKQVFIPNVLTVYADLTDTSGGQIINSTPLINIDDIKF